jgi:putative ABC transport system ATP-binding protein
MIKLENLAKIFRTEELETAALMDVSMQIEEGEFVSIMGPSGCGKSTLLNILGLLDQASAGSYHFLETEVANCSEKVRASLRKNNIGFVFQSFNLIDELSIYDNVELPLLYLKVPARERQERVHEVLEQYDLVARKGHFPQQLSGGQQQRSAVARAVITRPRLILADEPTGNLDSIHGDQVMESLTRLNEAGTTVVMVTHSEAYAGFGRRIIHLFDGHVVTERSLEARYAV